MSILAISGVIVSSAAMFIVLSGFSGLKNYSLEFISYVSPELKISPKKGKTFELKQNMISFLEKEKFSYGLSYEGKALLSINKRNKIVTVKGLSDGFPKKNIDSIMRIGKWFEEEEIVVGSSLALELGISPQDELNPATIYIPKPGKGQVVSEKDALRSKRVLTSGVFFINEEIDDNLIFCDLNFAKQLFNLKENEVGSIDIYDEASSAKINSFFGSGFEISDRIQQNPIIYKMLNTEQIAVYLIFSLIVVVALFNMFGALMMVVIEKRKNLDSLLVLGMTKKQIGNIFLFQGGLISLSGCAVGLIAGVLLVALQQSFSLFMISPSLAYPVTLEVKNFFYVFFTVVGLGCVASAIVSFYVKRSIQQISQR